MDLVQLRLLFVGAVLLLGGVALAVMGGAPWLSARLARDRAVRPRASAGLGPDVTGARHRVERELSVRHAHWRLFL